MMLEVGKDLPPYPREGKKPGFDNTARNREDGLFPGLYFKNLPGPLPKRVARIIILWRDCR